MRDLFKRRSGFPPRSAHRSPNNTSCNRWHSVFGFSDFQCFSFLREPRAVFPVIDNDELFSVKKKQLANVPRLDDLIREVRGRKVMLDFDLARVYGVETKSLNRAVKRNADRFPKDFMFQISPHEWKNLRYQIGTLKSGRGRHRKYLPYAFTEHGAIMAANVLSSPHAVQMYTTCGDAVGSTALVAW